ncbi:hypothetical protein Atai01_15740 [Amycolatopsis taiwanensis]|uniref:Uncharacterized protein n=1 Tax=Amycolatopsis taiwanensis TaxID=342230 RepID=A0A9W6VDN9_9PSEU|nr:hypothetical protein Atai01_15740 [Amycolatopsis taiwanensis]
MVSDPTVSRLITSLAGGAEGGDGYPVFARGSTGHCVGTRSAGVEAAPPLVAHRIPLYPLENWCSRSATSDIGDSSAGQAGVQGGEFGVGQTVAEEETGHRQ